MSKYGLRVFLKGGTAHVEGLDGTIVPVWKAVEDRAIGVVFLRRREIGFLLYAEDYLVQTAH